MSNLRQLSLRSNQIIDLPPAVGKMKRLEVLDLGNNDLLDLPDEISKLQNLRKLGLDGNRLSEPTCERIRKLLPNTEISFEQQRQ